jgi:type I restriction enzyme S subunit
MQLLTHTLRAAQPHLNREELNETIILYPPFVEQQTIVAHIEKEYTRLDTLIDKWIFR